MAQNYPASIPTRTPGCVAAKKTIGASNRTSTYMRPTSKKNSSESVDETHFQNKWVSPVSRWFRGLYSKLRFGRNLGRRRDLVKTFENPTVADKEAGLEQKTRDAEGEEHFSDLRSVAGGEYPKWGKEFMALQKAPKLAAQEKAAQGNEDVQKKAENQRSSMHLKTGCHWRLAKRGDSTAR